MTNPASEIAEISLKVNDNTVNFSNLSIHQSLSDVNSFSFIWRKENEEVTLNTHANFYKENLGKEVHIDISGNFIFKGIIYSINCFNQFAHNVEYEILGKGLMMTLDEVQQCNSWVNMPLKDILKDVIEPQKDNFVLEPASTENLYYTVQYNQTNFDFLRMMAARHGEWLYYNGEKMVLGKPDTSAVELKLNLGHLQNLNLSTSIHKSNNKIEGYDPYKGENIQSDKDAPAYGGSGFLDISTDGGKNVFTNSQSANNTSTATKNVLDKNNELYQQSVASNSVQLSASSHFSTLKLGGTIELKEEDDSSAGKFVIIKIQHTSRQNGYYANQFTAIPVEAVVPPNTNPNLFPFCKAQLGMVVKNEDKDGLARVKVKFPWQKNNDEQSTPWTSVVVPHAGNGKGFRFLPEVNDEVMVDFINNNAERPYVIGAIYTEKNKPGIPEAGNNIKVIGTRTGRRVEIDDDAGFVKLVDNTQGEKPINGMTMKRKDGAQFLAIASYKTDDTGSDIVMNDNGEGIEIRVTDGGTHVAEIFLKKDGKKIIIKSKGSIDIVADEAINLSASEINMDAGGKIKISKSGVEIDGQKVEITADTDFKATANANAEISGNAKTSVSGSAQLELSGGALAKLSAGIVQIN